MSTLLQLIEATHPNPQAAAVYNSLVGIETIKQTLVDELVLLLDRNRLDAWQKRHHPQGLPFLNGAAGKAQFLCERPELPGSARDQADPRPLRHQ